MQTNQNEAMRKQQELMASMQKAKLDYNDTYDEYEDDDMEQEFLKNMTNELAANTNVDDSDQYIAALDKLEEIKKNQNDADPQAQNQAREDEYDQPDDDMEERLLKDIDQSLKEETKDIDINSNFKEEYNKLIQDFSNLINSNRKAIPLVKISNVTDRVWALIDDWRDQEAANLKD